MKGELNRNMEEAIMPCAIDVVKKHGKTFQGIADELSKIRGGDRKITRGSLYKTLNQGNPTVRYLLQIAKASGINIVEFFPDSLQEYIEEHPQQLDASQIEFTDTITIMGKRYGLVPLEDSDV